MMAGKLNKVRFKGRCSIILYLILTSVITSCLKDEFDTTTEGRLSVFLTGLGIDYSSHMRGLNTQKYKFLTGQNNKLEPSMTDFASFIFSKKHRDTISGWQTNLAGIQDRDLKRQVEFLSKFYLINSVEFEKSILKKRYGSLETLMNSRFKYGGKSLTLNQMYLKACNAEKTEKEIIYTEIGPTVISLKHRLLELIKMRNDAVKKLGFADYPSLIFYIEEISPEMMDSLLSEIEAATAQIYRNLVIEKTGSQTPDNKDLIRVLDTDYMKNVETESFDKMTESAKTIFENIGIPQGGKIETAQCQAMKISNGFTVSIPSDYRIILGVSPSRMENVREFYYQYAAGQYYSNLYDTKTILNGFPNALGSCSRINRSMAANILLTIMRINSLHKDNQFFSRDSALEIYLLRKRLMTADFEWTLYADPTLDPEVLLRELAKKYLMIPSSEEPGFEWAMDYILLEEPFSYAMDIAGAAAGYQIYGVIQQSIKPQESNKIRYGEWLKTYIFRYGELYPWHKKVKDISGKALEPDDLIRYIQEKFQ